MLGFEAKATKRILNSIPSMANVIGVNTAAARPVQEGDHVYDFSQEYHLMCHNCKKTARIADELFKITTDELLFDNITR